MCENVKYFRALLGKNLKKKLQPKYYFGQISYLQRYYM